MLQRPSSPPSGILQRQQPLPQPAQATNVWLFGLGGWISKDGVTRVLNHASLSGHRAVLRSLTLEQVWYVFSVQQSCC